MGEDNIMVSLILGLMGGAFMCLCPCCFLSFRAQQQWTKTFLDETNPAVRRAEAIIQDKQSHVSNNSNGGSSTSYTMVLTFTAQGDGAQTVPVRAQVTVADAFWSRTAVGSATQVAYSVKNPKDFLIVENVRDSKISTGMKFGLMCFLGVFALAGAGMGAGSLLLTGCPLGLGPLVIILLGGCFWAQFACVPVARMIAASSFYVNTSGGEAPSEKSFVMNGQSATAAGTPVVVVSGTVVPATVVPATAVAA